MRKVFGIVAGTFFMSGNLSASDNLSNELYEVMYNDCFDDAIELYEIIKDHSDDAADIAIGFYEDCLEGW